MAGPRWVGDANDAGARGDRRAGTHRRAFGAGDPAERRSYGGQLRTGARGGGSRVMSRHAFVQLHVERDQVGRVSSARRAGDVSGRRAGHGGIDRRWQARAPGIDAAGGAGKRRGQGMPDHRRDGGRGIGGRRRVFGRGDQRRRAGRCGDDRGWSALAGSVSTMVQMVRNMAELAGASLPTRCGWRA